ncbi:MAG: glutamate--tRNA ligase, partial [Clostridia bacterium]|nr:glutamate--tRNA ligase [Clostridia bacterium]
MIRFLAEMPEYELSLYCHKKMKCDENVAKENLALVLPVIEGITDWTEANLHDAVMAAIAESGKKNGAVLWPLRIAISGLANTPGGAFEIAYLLGRDETLRRLHAAMEKLG